MGELNVVASSEESTLQKNPAREMERKRHGYRQSRNLKENILRHKKREKGKGKTEVPVHMPFMQHLERLRLG